MRRARVVLAIVGVLALTLVLIGVRTKLIRPAPAPAGTVASADELAPGAEDAPKRIVVVGASLYRIPETSLERGEARMLVETAARLDSGAADAATLKMLRDLANALTAEGLARCDATMGVIQFEGEQAGIGVRETAGSGSRDLNLFFRSRLTDGGGATLDAGLTASEAFSSVELLTRDLGLPLGPTGRTRMELLVPPGGGAVVTCRVRGVTGGSWRLLAFIEANEQPPAAPGGP
ncbi:MAG TPA: hypothetical protein PLU35_02695 [Phycisphaerales bacterium]|nr:hypothetical protein [Phycisphaerales bacterium]